MPVTNKTNISIREENRISIGDIVRCPRCGNKFLVLPGAIHYMYADEVVGCDKCGGVCRMADYIEEAKKPDPPKKKKPGQAPEG